MRRPRPPAPRPELSASLLLAAPAPPPLPSPCPFRPDPCPSCQEAVAWGGCRAGSLPGCWVCHGGLAMSGSGPLECCPPEGVHSLDPGRGRGRRTHGTNPGRLGDPAWATWPVHSGAVAWCSHGSGPWRVASPTLATPKCSMQAGPWRAALAHLGHVWSLQGLGDVVSVSADHGPVCPGH